MLAFLIAIVLHLVKSAVKKATTVVIPIIHMFVITNQVVHVIHTVDILLRQLTVQLLLG